MARVTVEDCILKVPNRFELVLVCGQRARNISSGAPITIDRDNDKNPVVALREVADGTVSIEELQKSLVLGLQKYVEAQELDSEKEENSTERELAALDEVFENVLVEEDGLSVVEEETDLDEEEEFEEIIDEEGDDFDDFADDEDELDSSDDL